MKEFLQNFNFNKREQRGLFVLFLLFIGLFYASQAIRFFHDSKISPVVIEELKQMNVKESAVLESANRIEAIKPIVHESIDFNATSKQELIDAGWPNFLAQRTANFLAKGGKIYSESDLQKLYGMNDSLQVVLGPTVKKYSIRSTKKLDRKEPANKPMPTFEKIDAFEAFEINAADSATWTTVRGIGPYFASKIVNFKTKLGGFHSFNQLYEVYRLDSNLVDSLESILAVNQDLIEQININTCSIDELKAHPYLRFNVARAIVNYRIQHGNYQNLTQIKNTGLVSDELYLKIAPYLKLQEGE